MRIQKLIRVNVKRGGTGSGLPYTVYAIYGDGWIWPLSANPAAKPLRVDRRAARRIGKTQRLSLQVGWLRDKTNRRYFLHCRSNSNMYVCLYMHTFMGSLVHLYTLVAVCIFMIRLSGYWGIILYDRSTKCTSEKTAASQYVQHYDITRFPISCHVHVYNCVCGDTFLFTNIPNM